MVSEIKKRYEQPSAMNDRLLWTTATNDCSQWLPWTTAMNNCYEGLLWRTAMNDCYERLLWTTAFNDCYERLFWTTVMKDCYEGQLWMMYYTKQPNTKKQWRRSWICLIPTLLLPFKYTDLSTFPMPDPWEHRQFRFNNFDLAWEDGVAPNYEPLLFVHVRGGERFLVGRFIISCQVRTCF